MFLDPDGQGEAVVVGGDADRVADDVRHRLDLDLRDLSARHRSFAVKKRVTEFVDQRLYRLCGRDAQPVSPKSHPGSDETHF